MEITRSAQSVILEQTAQESVHHQARQEASSVELKKQTEQAKRFSNEGLKNHSQLKNVKGALQTLQPDQLVKLLKSATQSINGNTTQTNLDNKDIPLLKTPVNSQSSAAKSSSETKLSGSAAATAILGKVMQLTSEASLSQQLSQIQSYNLTLSAAANVYSELAIQLELQGTQWASEADALAAAQKQADALADDVNKAQSALDEAQAAVDHTLNGTTNLQKEVDEAQEALTKVTNTYNNFVSQTLNPAIAAESSSRAAVEATTSKSQAYSASFSTQQQSAIEAQRQQTDESSKTLAFLMALISELINKSTNDDLEASAELKQKLAEASAKDAEKKAKEYEEQTRKAEEMQKTMACVGKILGWVITAVSFAAAAFTGGASLAIAAVGLALAVGDEIGQAITGKSYLSEYVMNPIMEHTIKPMMEFFAKEFSAMLQAYGVDKEKAELAGQILGAIAAAVVMVVVMVVAGSVASKLGGAVLQKLGLRVAEDVGEQVAKEVAEEVAEEVTEKVAEKVTQTTAQKLMSSSVGQVLKNMSGGVGKTLGMEAEQSAKIANYIQKAATGLEFVNTVSQESVGIAAAQIEVDASKTKAEMMKDLAIQDVLNEMMDRAVDVFTNRMTTLNEMVKNMSAAADTQMQAGKYITKRMSTVAA